MAKYLAIFLVVVVFLASFLTVYYTKDSYRMLPVKEVQPSTPAVETFNFHEWREYTPPNEAFRVLFPTLPQSATEKVPDTKTNTTRKYNMYASEKNDGTIFMITLITFEESAQIKDSDALMKRMIEDMMKANSKNELRAIESTKYKGYDAINFAFGNNETIVDARIFVDGNTLYILSRISKVAATNTNEYRFFLNSFDLSPFETPKQ